MFLLKCDQPWFRNQAFKKVTFTKQSDGQLCLLSEKKKVFPTESNAQKRKIREAFLIDKVRDKNMNMDRRLNKLSPLWLDLLREKK